MIRHGRSLNSAKCGFNVTVAYNTFSIDEWFDSIFLLNKKKIFMNFSKAYQKLNEGKIVSRRSWDGDFLWMKPSTMIKTEWCKDPILKAIVENNGGEIKAEATLSQYNAKTNSILTGYNPTQIDLIANDWFEIIKEPKYKEGDLFENVTID